MGAQTLKRKKELNYRRGPTWSCCGHCNHFVPVFQVHNLDGSIKGEESRCRIMGLRHGRAYRINPKNICDRHDNSRYMKRLKGEQ